MPGFDDLRAAWVAARPNHALSSWPKGGPTHCVYHYVGGAGVAKLVPHEQCLTFVKAIQHGEMTPGVHPWTYVDLSYCIVVCQHGKVIEGRGLQFQGGAQEGDNELGLPILFLMNVGNVMTADLAHGAYRARELVLWAYPKCVGQFGHRDVAHNPTGTACPGAPIEAWLAAGGAAHDSIGTTPAQPPAPAPASPVLSVVEYSEDDVKTAIVHVPIGSGATDSGKGWAAWDPGLGRDPIIVGAVLNGPYPPRDKGYWYDEALPIVAAQNNGHEAIVSVVHAKPGVPIDVRVSVA